MENGDTSPEARDQIKSESADSQSPTRGIILTLVMLVPLTLIVLFLFLYRPVSNLAAPNRSSAHSATPGSPAAEHDGRLIVLIIDSLRRQAVDELMPNLKAFSHQPTAVDLDVQTASANMSLPCIQTLLEGRESPFASAIYDFTGQWSGNNSLPHAAAQAGLKLALIGDFIITGLYGAEASVVIGENSLPKRNPEQDLSCDVCLVDKAMELLSDPDIRVLILHLPGTDHVAHKWKPHHPEYDRHYREVDEKLVEFFRVFDLNKDYVIVTGDHGHNDLGNHVPQSVAIFAGGLYPPLFRSIGPIKELHQVDMLFFMAFAENLPLPIGYEGSYFGAERLINSPKETSLLQTRMTAFVDLQRETLSAAGFSAPTLEGEIAAQRNEAKTIHPNRFRSLLPLIVLYLGWVVLAFYVNDHPDASIWLLMLPAIAAIPLWFFCGPALGIGLSIIIGVAIAIAALNCDEMNRLAFLIALMLIAALTAYAAENWATVFKYRAIIAIAVGAGLALIRARHFSALPAGIFAFSLFALPSGPFRNEAGFFMVRGLVLGCSVLVLQSAARSQLPQFRLREWLAAVGLVISLGTLPFQTASGGFVHNTLFTALETSRIGPAVTLLVYLSVSAYLIWAVPGARNRLITAAFVLILPAYCSVFARLSFALLTVVLIVPVVIVSWLTWQDRAGPWASSESVREETNALILLMACLIAFWMLFQGFFVQQIDFSFGMRYLNVGMPENREFAILYPFTLLKYGLPLALIVFVYSVLRGETVSPQTIIAALIFCNFKMATLLLQSLTGPLHSHQKLYEFAMSDFVFVSQMTVILALSYLMILLAARTRRAPVDAWDLATAVP